MKAWYSLAGLLVLAGVIGLAWLDRVSPPGVIDPNAVSHVHALALNPADRSLLAATHYGLLQLSSDQQAERVGETFQDMMGLAVVGPDELLASGHPDVAGRAARHPPRLGLLRSVDGGASWWPMSLGGEADFHGLAYAHDAVYGWDSTTSQFMISPDLVTWTVRSTIGLSSFAVNPADPDHIVGAGPAGLIESADGGRSWIGAGGPPMVRLGWHAGEGLWGADAEGGIWRRDGAEWQRAGFLPGEPEALLVAGDAVYAAARSFDGRTVIVESVDGGQSWSERYQSPE